MPTSLTAVPTADMRRVRLDVLVSDPFVQIQSHDGAHDPARSPSLDATVSPVEAAEQHVLIVDDERDIRKMLRRLLEDEGYTVGEAADGAEGLGYLRTSPHQLVVLLDYRMPHMDGEEMLDAVLADPSLAGRHAIIFVTANLLAFSPRLVKLLETAAIPVIQKPFQLQAILDEIERAIARLGSSTDTPAP